MAQLGASPSGRGAGVRAASDSSLAEMKASVRRKLALPPDTPLQLVQLRNGRNIDLEDGQLSSFDRVTIP